MSSRRPRAPAPVAAGSGRGRRRRGHGPRTRGRRGGSASPAPWTGRCPSWSGCATPATPTHPSPPRNASVDLDIGPCRHRISRVTFGRRDRRHLQSHVVIQTAGAAAPRLIDEPVETLSKEPAAPHPDLMLVHPDRAGDLTQRHPARSQDRPRPPRFALVEVCARARRSSSARSSTVISNGSTLNTTPPGQFTTSNHTRVTSRV